MKAGKGSGVSMNNWMQAEISSYPSQGSLCPPPNPTLSLLAAILPCLLFDHHLPLSSPALSLLDSASSTAQNKEACRGQNGVWRPQSLGCLKSKGQDGERGVQEPEEMLIFCLWKVQTLEPTQGPKRLTGVSRCVTSRKHKLLKTRIWVRIKGGGHPGGSVG